MISGMGLWTCALRKILGTVPCCGLDGYRAQVPQHPIDSYKYIHIFKIIAIILCFSAGDIMTSNTTAIS